ncbi:MAG TPA: alpha/beta hydrolase [Acidimicrobiales bacterium]|nr:alpha/beta hydrolase [Acidimicrobiales bacterium]
MSGVWSPSGRARTADGVGVAYYELGGSGPALLLVHATGFCGAVLGPMAGELIDRYRCIAFDLRGHGCSDRPPGGDFGWYGFAADVLGVVDHLGLEEVAGFGHSCGGAALLLAEEARTGTFRALYCFEPIVYAGETPPAPTADGNPLSDGARRRREIFGSRDEALENFSGKAPFDQLDPEVLAAYLDNGFAPGADGIRLRCHREDEAEVYDHSLAHDAFGHLGDVRCPVTLACGAETDAIGPGALKRFARRLARSQVEVYSGLGHFGPLADPGAVARSVGSSLHRMGVTPTA